MVIEAGDMHRGDQRCGQEEIIKEDQTLGESQAEVNRMLYELLLLVLATIFNAFMNGSIEDTEEDVSS